MTTTRRPLGTGPRAADDDEQSRTADGRPLTTPGGPGTPPDPGPARGGRRPLGPGPGPDATADR
ncbi:hypothetical protein [Streptomyces crystallinus]|uniref:Uncharacterized protein n=1 Tax=Streptomyces crystallinus TaxID=68191 RepID=A0ABP3QTR7_9ACTN